MVLPEKERENLNAEPQTDKHNDEKH